MTRLLPLLAIALAVGGFSSGGFPSGGFSSPVQAQEAATGGQSFLLVLGENEVRVLAAPQEPNWDGVSERSLWVRCREFKFKYHNDSGFAIECHGSVTVASKTYHARAGVLLIRDDHKRLEFQRDANTQVQLWRRTAGNSPVARLTANRITWWPEQNRLEVEGSSVLETFNEK